MANPGALRDVPELRGEKEKAPWTLTAARPETTSAVSSDLAPPLPAGPSVGRARARSRAVDQRDFLLICVLRGTNPPPAPLPFGGSPRPTTYLVLVAALRTPPWEIPPRQAGTRATFCSEVLAFPSLSFKQRNHVARRAATWASAAQEICWS